MRCGPQDNAAGRYIGMRVSGMVHLAPYLEMASLYHLYKSGFTSSKPPYSVFAADGEPWCKGGLHPMENTDTRSAMSIQILVR